MWPPTFYVQDHNLLFLRTIVCICFVGSTDLNLRRITVWCLCETREGPLVLSSVLGTGLPLFPRFRHRKGRVMHAFWIPEACVCVVVSCDGWDLVVVCVPCDMYGGPLPAFLSACATTGLSSLRTAFILMEWTTCVCLFWFCVCVCLPPSM